MSATTRLASVLCLSALFTIPISTTAVGAQSTETACGPAPAGYNVIESDKRFIVGTPEADFICAGDSNNIIRARGKDDIIHAGGGNDIVWGGYGDDTIWAGDGDDVVRSGAGTDAVSAGDGDDIVFAGNGMDTVHGDAGDDQLTGGDGHDTLNGGDGHDTLIGNRGFDTIIGGSGNDNGQGGKGNDSLLGGDGDDVMSGGDHDDALGGGNGNDRLLGGNGTDTLIGGNGDDALIGGGNPDELRGSAGNDIIDGGNGLNVAIGGPGLDVCKNTDDPASACEIVDGIDQFVPPARLWLIVPSSESPGALLAGTSWTANAEIDVSVVDSDGHIVLEEQQLMSDDEGNWDMLIAARALDATTIVVGDSTAGREKTLTPVLEAFEWDQAAEDLVITGPVGETMEAHIAFPSDVLVFVEQMTFDETGTAIANFSEVDTIGHFELRRNDDDGDVEIHANITRTVAPVIEVPAVEEVELRIASDLLDGDAPVAATATTPE